MHSKKRVYSSQNPDPQDGRTRKRKHPKNLVQEIMDDASKAFWTLQIRVWLGFRWVCRVDNGFWEEYTIFPTPNKLLRCVFLLVVLCTFVCSLFLNLLVLCILIHCWFVIDLCFFYSVGLPLYVVVSSSYCYSYSFCVFYSVFVSLVISCICIICFMCSLMYSY